MHSNNSSNNVSGKNKKGTNQRPSVHLQGIGVSAGIVKGKALFAGQAIDNVPERKLSSDEVEEEVMRFQEALNLSYAQLEEIKNRIAQILGDKDASIFDAHMMLVSDQVIHDEVVQGIREQQRNAEAVYKDVVERYSAALKDVHDVYIRDRLTDIRDVAARIIRNLQSEEITDLTNLPYERIIVGRDLSPSDTASMDRENVLAFATTLGSRTSHTAIMARSLNLPAVVGVTGLTKEVANGDTIIVDGNRGKVIVRPDEEALKYYENRVEEQRTWFNNLEAEAELPPETLDGFRVQLAANVELPNEVRNIKESYGVGIGLFRTEYMFVNRSEMPTEEEQFEAYRQVAQEILPESMIVRTVDLGGDKFLSRFELPNELNPFLGMRAIRFCLAKPELFLSQLRAILRASAHGKIRIMFPMIATVEELKKALEYLDEAKKQLTDEGYDYNPYLDVGMMVEIPAAAMLADQLAPYVDFFSIGTNDLIQYSLAVDRANPEVSYLYQPSHPTILRFLHQVTHAAYSHGKWVSLCGEMASEPVLAPLVLGLGIHELSMSPIALGGIKRLIRRMRMYEAEDLLRQAMQCETGAKVWELSEDYVRRNAPELVPE